MVIEARNISHSFGQEGRHVQLFENLSFTVKNGQFVTVCGPSGSGKTTLLSILAGFIEPQGGEILIDGKNIVSGPAKRRRDKLLLSRISYMMQSASLLHRLNVRENILVAAEIAGVKKAGIKADELLEKLGLSDRKKAMPERLSGGEYRRVMLARTLVLEPELILADEPTANLDEESALMVRTLLREYAGDNKAVIVASHDEKLLSGSEKIKLK